MAYQLGAAELPALEKLCNGACGGGAVAWAIKGFDPPEHLKSRYLGGFCPRALIDLDQIIRSDERLIGEGFEMIEIHRAQNSTRLDFLKSVEGGKRAHIVYLDGTISF
jgi:site-specific DNA-adenine methylase